MGLIVKNNITTLRVCLTLLKFMGFLVPHEPIGYLEKIYFNIYWFFWLMIVVGALNISQIGAIIENMGDIALMTSALFLLLTNMALAIKIVNVVVRRHLIQDIINISDDELSAEDRVEGIYMINSCNRETVVSLCAYFFLASVTCLGWAASTQTGQLPLTAWYPFDTSESPIYELIYFSQVLSLIISAQVNMSLDNMVASLISVCRCRLRLVGLSLRTLCDKIHVPDGQMLSVEAEAIVRSRLHDAAVKHEAALKTAEQIQGCFSLPIFTQFSVSTVIICFSAYQLALELETRNWVLIISLVTYLLAMMLQVFIYCYQGNQLTEESSEIADAVYSCEWYSCSVGIRRELLILMVRTCRVTRLTAGGITVLSLACFTSIIKGSYTFFTVLRQVEDRSLK